VSETAETTGISRASAHIERIMYLQ